MVDEILLYDLGDSPFCLKARLCLQLKGVPFRRVTLTIGRLRELRRLNPLGKVPVLVQGTDVVPDSRAIARHLEARYPAPSLLPEDAMARAYAGLVEEWADEALSFLIGAFKWLNPENRAAAVANTVNEVVAGWLRPALTPLMVHAIRGRYRASGYRSASLPQLEARMRDNLAVLATLLGDRPFLLGQRATLADLATFAQLSWMRRYAEGRLLDDVPIVASWLDRLSEEPAVAAAVAA